jgi:ethanolamine utilization protein EutA
MIGLDFGSTTSSAMVATAGVGLSCTTGRMEFGLPQVVYRSEPVFTPFNDEKIDSARLEGLIDRWITESGVRHEAFFAGGVIITGLAAKRANAAALARLIGERIGEAVVAAADDPCLESWLAFMGSCSVLSRFHAETPFINIDIGGGTTNPAFGINGSVLYTGCHYVGARHFQFEPGTYQLTGMSPYGRALLKHLGIEKSPGKDLAPREIDAILNFYIAALEAIASGNTGFFSSPITSHHQQVPFAYESTGATPVLVFSGGVGELIYRIDDFSARRRHSSSPGSPHRGASAHRCGCLADPPRPLAGGSHFKRRVHPGTIRGKRRRLPGRRHGKSGLRKPQNGEIVRQALEGRLHTGEAQTARGGAGTVQLWPGTR